MVNDKLPFNCIVGAVTVNVPDAFAIEFVVNAGIVPDVVAFKILLVVVPELFIVVDANVPVVVIPVLFIVVDVNIPVLLILVEYIVGIFAFSVGVKLLLVIIPELVIVLDCNVGISTVLQEKLA